MTDEERRVKNAERQRAWRAANRERAREQARENARKWREANPERAREIKRASDQKRREEQPDLVREQDRERMAAWRVANPERNLENDRRWRETNPEKSREKQQRYRETHPDKVVERNAAYSADKKERRLNDPEWAQEQRDRATLWAEQNPEKIMEKYRQYRSVQENVLRDQLRGIERRAKKEAIRFDQRLYLRIPPPNCQSCGVLFETVEPNPGGGRRINLRALSHDRVVPKDGYTLENVNYICFRCNEIKRNATLAELEAIVAYIKRHTSQQ